MAMALTHFAFGAICATVLVSYLFPESRYPRTVIVASGLWAMLPDLYQVAPIFEPQLRALHGSLITNLWWFHHLLDVADSAESQRFAAVMVGVLGLVTLLAEERDYSPDERLGR